MFHASAHSGKGLKATVGRHNELATRTIPYAFVHNHTELGALSAKTNDCTTRLFGPGR